MSVIRLTTDLINKNKFYYLNKINYDDATASFSRPRMLRAAI